MEYKYRNFDCYNGADERSTKREKVKISDIALKTFLIYNISMTKMKYWMNEQSIFESTIYNQTEKIHDLQANNDPLAFGEQKLKSCEPDTEMRSPEIKLRQLFRDDEKIDALVADSTSKIIRTIDDLSKELENAHQTMNVLRKINTSFQIKGDKLSTDSCERLNEFNDFIHHIDEKTHMLKNILESVYTDRYSKTNEQRTKNVELLVKELKMKLETDWHALFNGGDPYWFVYMKKIAKLEDSLKGLLQQLDRTKEFCDRSYDSSHSIEYPKAINELEELVKRVGSSLKTLKTEPTKISCKVGGESCIEYFKRIKTLKKLVETFESIINGSIIVSKGCSDDERAPRSDRDASLSKYIEALEDLAKKFKSGIKELEIAVPDDDSKILIQKMKELEYSVKRLNKEVAVKNEENNSIGLELRGAKIAYKEKVEDLEKLQLKYRKIVKKMKNHGQLNADENQQRMENIVRELEQTKRDARDEVNGLRVDVENLQKEREKLLKEINKKCATIEDRDNQLLNISKEKDSIEKTLTKSTNEKNRKLINAMEEIKCLKDEISKLKDEIDLTSNRRQSVASEATEIELNRLKALLKDTTKSLERKSNDCDNFKSNLNEVLSDKTRIEVELSSMKIENDALIDHLNSEKVTTVETLKDCNKIMADFRLQENELHTARTKRSSLKENLEQSEHEKVALKAEVNELRQGNITLHNKSLSLQARVNNLTRNLEELTRRESELETQLKKSADEKIEQNIVLEKLNVEISKLNDELDKARSDKLDIVGTLNKCRLQYEDTKNLLDSKINEIKRLKRALDENEELKMREATTKLEMTRLLEANIELRGTIDVMNSDKAGLEEQLKCLNKECQALRSGLAVSNSDNNALRDESNGLRRRTEILMEDVKKLTSEVEQRSLERTALESKYRDITEKHQRQLDDYEIEHNTLKIELMRLRSENTSLKSESNRMSLENEKMRRNSGKKGELSRLNVENEGLKYELANLRNVNSKADKAAKEADITREELCQELQALHTERCKLTMLMDKTLKDSRTMKEHLEKLKLENNGLRKDIEEAKNNIANRENRTNELKAKTTVLEITIEELKKLQRDSKNENEEMRSLNENLAKEISNLNKEDVALRDELNSLRLVIKKVNDDNSKTKIDFAKVEEELEALKGELSSARVENSLLKTQFDGKKTESCKLESENVALKEKLEKVRQSKMSEAEDVNQLRSDYEILKLHKVTLESKLMDALKEIGKYTVATSKLNGLEDKLKGILKDYVGTKRLLRSANEEVDHLRRTTAPYVKSFKYNENVDAT